MNKLTLELIKQLPKVELHCHLDGSLRVDTIIDLAKKNNIDLPTIDKNKLSKLISLKSQNISLEKYIALFDITLSVMQSKNSLERISYELMEDLSNDNVVYAEIRFSPILHTKNNLTIDDALRSVKTGLEKGSKKFGIKYGIIICGIRSIDPSVSIKLAELAVDYKNNNVVGFDLAGAEYNYPAKKHKEAFYIIRNNNINTTIHAGEAFGPESIHQAIHTCGANRIGHGIRLLEDPDLMSFINDHRICLEICLTSNYHTGAVKSLSDHPFKFYYDNGLRVSINTDNRLISGTNLSEEYFLASQLFKLKIEDIREIIIMSMKSAFMPHQLKTKMIKAISSELENNFEIFSNYL